MITVEVKMDYISNRTCLGCGFDPEVVAWYKKDGSVVGYIDSCGAMIIDDIVIGFDAPR